MRAIVYNGYGGPETTTLTDRPAPRPAAGEVLIRVDAAGLNPIDVHQRDGALRSVIRYTFPKIAGNELSGIVAGVGEGVTAFTAGDRVFARVDKRLLGAFAEEASVAEEFVAEAPRTLSLIEAAAVPLAGLTALQGLGRAHLAVGTGDRMLITGGAGGVGLFAIQLAKHAGAHVTTTASAEGDALVRRFGADEVIDYRARSISSGSERFDKVFDLVGGPTLDDLVDSVVPGGSILSVAGPLTSGSLDDEVRGIKRLAINAALRSRSRGIRRRARAARVDYQYFFMHPDGDGLAELAGLIDEGLLKVEIDSSFPLEQFADAFARVESRRAKGKVLLTFDA
ncbi:NADP-dependent oxidoreductase [Diaminobutyricibacter tongyongensis]|uniref:NADP-dependent oxidoreductase n=1 Tax=Leifsonia tongyongensis TaxID=1268043 RepID=A0A6L9XY58_9MICO|nr:NADP-dependent oxidoreductase [Diaminobutyricibacter tongyongensis]NEN06147.1 NADP-dependent oxidoreductase [Diaminobutyricibacter tongyongensis]